MVALRRWSLKPKIGKKVCKHLSHCHTIFQTDSSLNFRVSWLMQGFRKVERKLKDRYFLVMFIFSLIPQCVGWVNCVFVYREGKEFYKDENYETNKRVLPPFDFDITEVFAEIIQNHPEGQHLNNILFIALIMSIAVALFGGGACCAQKILKNNQLKHVTLTKIIWILYLLIWLICYVPNIFLSMESFPFYYQFDVDSETFHNFMIHDLKFSVHPLYKRSIPYMYGEDLFDRQNITSQVEVRPSSWDSTMEEMVKLNHDMEERTQEMEKLTNSITLGHIPDYNTTDPWKRIQLTFECCGVDSFKDWAKLHLVSAPRSHFKPNVPDSCCISIKEGCGSNVFKNQSKQDNIHKLGCLPFLKENFNEYMRLKTLWFQLFCMTSAVILICVSVLMFLCARSRRSSLPMVQRAALDRPDTNEEETRNGDDLYTEDSSDLELLNIEAGIDGHTHEDADEDADEEADNDMYGDTDSDVELLDNAHDEAEINGEHGEMEERDSVLDWLEYIDEH